LLPDIKADFVYPKLFQQLSSFVIRHRQKKSVGDIAAPLLRCPRDGGPEAGGGKVLQLAADRTLVRRGDRRHVV